MVATEAFGETDQGEMAFVPCLKQKNFVNGVDVCVVM